MLLWSPTEQVSPKTIPPHTPEINQTQLLPTTDKISGVESVANLELAQIRTQVTEKNRNQQTCCASIGTENPNC